MVNFLENVEKRLTLGGFSVKVVSVLTIHQSKSDQLTVKR